MSHVLAGHRMPIGLFRFRIAPLQMLLVPSVNKGNMLRGSFGHALRRVCCVPQCEDARRCPLLASCPYRSVFEPSRPPGAESLSKNQDIPRPFVFRAPQTKKTRFEKGEPFGFDLVLVGNALDFLPYFVLSFRELAAEGLGLNRAKCCLERVEQIKPVSNGVSQRNCGTEVVYSAEDQLFRATPATKTEEWIENRFHTSVPEVNGSIERLTIQFVTPTLLRANGEIVHQPDFHHIIKRLRDRVNALCTFFGDGPLEADFSGVGKRAENVQTAACNVAWSERFRTSSKTHQRHELSGFVGESVYEGELDEFLPWLAIGELIHIGKHAAWGNGELRVTLQTKGC